MKQKESLIPNDFVSVAKKTVLVRIQIYCFDLKIVCY